MAPIPHSPFVSHLGIRVLEADAGHAHLTLDVAPPWLNGFGVVHGGVLATLADVAMAHAARSLLNPGDAPMGCVTIDLHTQFMQAADPAASPLHAHATVLHRTPTLVFADVRVHDHRQTLCAHATGTFKWVRRLPDRADRSDRATAHSLPQNTPNTDAHGLVWHLSALNGMPPLALYRLLQLRVGVFVVEQQCAYPELDGADPECLHLWAERPNPAGGAADVVAAARLVPAGLKFAEASVGRVVTASSVRGLRLGHALVDRALQALAQTWGPQPVRIAAQAHLQAFYAQHGFAPVSPPYLEDGIAHVDMLRPAL